MPIKNQKNLTNCAKCSFPKHAFIDDCIHLSPHPPKNCRWKPTFVIYILNVCSKWKLTGFSLHRILVDYYYYYYYYLFYFLFFCASNQFGYHKYFTFVLPDLDLCGTRYGLMSVYIYIYRQTLFSHYWQDH